MPSGSQSASTRSRPPDHKSPRQPQLTHYFRTSNTPHELIGYTQDQGLLVEAYSPVAHGELLKNEEITAIAEKYGVSVPQLSIRYDLQLGTLPLPKTANPEHMRNNADVDFVISNDDMESLKNVKKIEDYGDASTMPVFAKR